MAVGSCTIRNPKSAISSSLSSTLSARTEGSDGLRAEGRNGSAAFTLVEIIVVITILALLIGLLLPSINRAKQLAYLAATRAYITQLSNGALMYQKDTGYYPGQQPEIVARIGSDEEHPGDDLFSGSQVLSACLFGLALQDESDGNEIGYLDSDGEFTTDPEEGAPTSPYVLFKKNDVLWSDENDDGVLETRFIPADRFSNDHQAILYYPSRLGNDGTIGAGGIDAFVYDDNTDLSTTNDRKRSKKNPPSKEELEQKWVESIQDDRFDPAQVYKSDSFLLIGSGLDRFFFLEDDQDRWEDNSTNY